MDKPESEFTPYRRKALMQGNCRECDTAWHHDHYHNGGRKPVMESARQRRLAVVNAIKAERGCRECGEHDPACLDFHHCNPDEKVRGIGTLVCRNTNIAKILEEIEKCDVICANCHRKWHAKHGRPSQWNKKKPDRVEAQQTLRLA
jgi:hypothetical protein